MKMIYLCLNNKLIISLFILLSCSNNIVAQLSVDTVYNFERNKKSLPIVFMVDTTKLNSTDSAYKNLLHFTCINPSKKENVLNLVYALNKNEYLSNGKDKLKDFLNIDSNSIILNDAIFINLLKRKIVLPLELIKQDAENSTNQTNNINGIATYWPLALGGLLAVFGLYGLTKKNKINSDMDKVKFFDAASKIQGLEIANKKDSYDDVLSWLKSNKDDFEASKPLLVEASKNAERQTLQIKNLQAEVATLQAAVNRVEATLTYANEFNAKMNEQYLQQFQKQFEAGSLAYPLNAESKKEFTATIYAIAFHYMSYVRSLQQRADGNDVTNKNMLFSNSAITDTNKIVPLQTDADIQKFNADVLFVAEELKRNNVTELKHVNYKGYYFKS